jgi:hypothetical protein
VATPANVALCDPSMELVVCVEGCKGGMCLQCGAFSCDERVRWSTTARLRHPPPLALPLTCRTRPPCSDAHAATPRPTRATTTKPTYASERP